MAKNRRKKRRKRQGGQAAAAEPPALRPSRVAPEERPDVVAARPSGPGTEGAVVGTVVEVDREFIWLDVGGERAMLYASELMLGIGERPADRYAVGNRFEAAVFQMGPDPESGAMQFSIRRASPYPEVLADFEVGAEVQATVVNTYDAGIELDVGGVRGNIFVPGLPLPVGESTHQKYQPGGQITARIHAIEVNDRALVLSARQYAPGYMEALQRYAVGDVISATVTVFQSNGGLGLDVNGLVGLVSPWELTLAYREFTRDHYVSGETIDGLLVGQVDYEDRVLRLSVKRNSPGYVEALRRYTVGDVVSGLIANIDDNGDLILEVDGVVGYIWWGELDLTDGESAQGHYTVGETINDLFIWQVNYEARRIDLSAKRNAPNYMETLQGRAVGDVTSGTVTILAANHGLWLDVDGAIGWIFEEEALLGDGETLAERYSVGDSVTAVVRHVDRVSRTVLLSARQSGLALVEEPIVLGATIKVMVVRKRDGGIDVSTDGESERYIPDYALSLRPGGSLDLEIGQEIDVVVMDVEDGVPTVLSHRRALAGWEAARDRLAAGVVVPDARVIPWVDRPNRDDGRAAVDLGPLTGFIPLDERDAAAAEDLMSRRANRRHGVVIEELDEEVWTASVSEAKFEARWRSWWTVCRQVRGSRGRSSISRAALRRSISASACWERCR